MSNPPIPEPTRYDTLSLTAGTVFSPSAPIDRQDLFAGRIHQLRKSIDAVVTKGQHVVLYGERGVGKTSLAVVLSGILRSLEQINIVTIRENCHSDDTFSSIWRRAVGSVVFTSTKPGIGFAPTMIAELKSLGAALPSSEFGPADVATVLRGLSASIVFVFDEFDQVKTKTVAKQFAETIKALSDYAVPSTIVLVGVGDSVDALLAAHASVERALVQILVPRMPVAERMEIFNRALQRLEMTCDEDMSRRLVQMSQGLPHYVHLLGLHTVRKALERKCLRVESVDLEDGIRAALGDISQSVLDTYLKAVSSPRKNTLFRMVLLACALAKADDLGYFPPADVRDPLRAMGKDLEIASFASHLNGFMTKERSEVLVRSGIARRYRYRFRNPLLQPFVVMRGIGDGLISVADVDRLLNS